MAGESATPYQVRRGGRCLLFKKIKLSTGVSELKKSIFMLAGILLSMLCYAENSIESLFHLKEYPHENISVTKYAWTECLFFSFENINGIDSLFYFPPENSKENSGKAILEINSQQFVINDINMCFVSPEIKLYSVLDKEYLIFFGEIGKYGDRICFIFDITNPNHIILYQPEERFIDKNIVEKFIGIYQNKLCFFFSTRRFNWNSQYRLSPYFIEQNSLKELCDENGNPYFVNYSYTTKYEQEYVIEDKNIPDIE